MGHCQVILRLERRCVRLVRSRRNSVRNRAAIAPIHPHVSNACPTVLRRSCPNGVSRTGRPGKPLRGTMRITINSERETRGICSDCHLNRKFRCRCGCGLRRNSGGWRESGRRSWCRRGGASSLCLKRAFVYATVHDAIEARTALIERRRRRKARGSSG